MNWSECLELQVAQGRSAGEDPADIAAYWNQAHTHRTNLRQAENPILEVIIIENGKEVRHGRYTD